MKSPVTVLVALVFVGSLGLGCPAGIALAEDVVSHTPPYIDDCSDAAFRASHGLALPLNAMESCNAALNDALLSPKDRASLYVNRAVIFHIKHNLESAERDLDDAMRIMPQLPEIWVNLGALRISQKRNKEAVVALNRSLELGLQDAEVAYYNRALARENLGDVRGAYQDLKMAESLAPDCFATLESSGLALV